MHVHGSSCLEGPRTLHREWWTVPGQSSPTLSFDNATADAREDQPIRTELVERIRREIAAGQYETPEKWQAALERLARRLEA